MRSTRALWLASCLAPVLWSAGCTSDDDKNTDDTDIDWPGDSDSDATDTEVDDTEDEDTDLVDTDDGDTDGSDTDDGDTDGSDTDGGNTDGSDTDGGDTDGSDTDGADTDAPISATGSLILSEYCDPDASGMSNARFIELYNAGTTDVDLSQYQVIRNANGGSAMAPITMSGMLTPGSVFVIANSASTFSSVFPTAPAPDITSQNISGNGNDAFGLEDLQGNLVDILGEYGVDGLGTDWEYTDECIRRVNTVSAGNTVWTLAEWSFDGAVSAGAGTPGTHP